MAYTFVSGNIALDFAGTLGHRRTDGGVENLDSPTTLAEWTVAAGLLDTCETPTGAELATALELREAIYRSTVPEAELADMDRDVINHLAAAGLPLAQLSETGSISRIGTSKDALAAVARVAVELIGGSDRDRIKECGGEECTRLYLDLSRAMSRRWCDMTLCGNRAKGAAFRARTSH